MSFHEAKLNITSVNIINIIVQRGSGQPLLFGERIMGTKRNVQKEE